VSVSQALPTPAGTEPLEPGLARVRTLWRLWRREKVDPDPFYRLLAAELAASLEERHGSLTARVLIDLGCGPGAYTDALRARGAKVLAIDNDPAALALGGETTADALLADAAALPLPDASVDGVVCSNLLEHTPDPEAVLREIARVLEPGGFAYISWTNWYSPWGGHEFVPYQYLGPRLGPALHRRLHGPVRKNAYGEGLWYTHIGRMLRIMREMPGVQIDRVEPRYWPRLNFIVSFPGLREVLTWNCVIHARKL
jgi:SAM-dependent methyltransferase